MPTLIKDLTETKALKSEKKAEIKAPTIYVCLKGTRESVKRIIGELFTGLAHLDIHVIFDEEVATDEGLQKSDLILLLNENEKLLKKAWSEGVVSITNSFNSQVVNYNPNSEAGNSFTFKNFNEWEIFAAIVRALETYKFPYDWKFIERSCRKAAA